MWLRKGSVSVVYAVEGGQRSRKQIGEENHIQHLVQECVSLKFGVPIAEKLHYCRGYPLLPQLLDLIVERHCEGTVEEGRAKRNEPVVSGILFEFVCPDGAVAVVTLLEPEAVFVAIYPEVCVSPTRSAAPKILEEGDGILCCQANTHKGREIILTYDLLVEVISSSVPERASCTHIHIHCILILP